DEIAEIRKRMGMTGAGDQDEATSPDEEEQGGKPTVAKQPAPETDENPITGESGALSLGRLNPVAIKQQYAAGVEDFIGKHKLGDKYYAVRNYDPRVAETLHRLDNAPRAYREKAIANLAKVTQGLTEDQIRLAHMMVDSDSRDYLESAKPAEYSQALHDPRVMDAVNRFKPLQDELTRDREALSWPVRKSLSVEENEAAGPGEDRWMVKDRDGNPIDSFRSEGEARQYVEDNATVEP